MFEDKRSKKVVLLAHCLLNQNAISDGTSDYPTVFSEVIKTLVDNQVSIIQMPCPELICLGLDRGDQEGCKRHVLEENSRIRNQLLAAQNQVTIKKLVDHVFFQVHEYLKNGFTIHGIIGVNRSPSCGVNSTSADNKEISGKGLFIEQLLEKFKQENIHCPVVGVKTTLPDNAVASVKWLLNESMTSH